MRKTNLILLLFFTACVCNLAAQSRSVEIPEGTIVRALRSDDKSALYIEGQKIYIDDINNIRSDYWRFYFCGSKDGLAGITTKPSSGPSGWTSTLAIQKGYAFVGRLKMRYDGEEYWARFYVAEMLTNKDNEIIGARIAYQAPFYTDEEIAERAARTEEERLAKEAANRAALAETEARRIFWNGTEVSDEKLRDFYLKNYDTNKNGKIEQAEAEAVTEFHLHDDTKYSLMSFTGIKNFINIESVHISGVGVTFLVDFSDMNKLKTVHIERCPYIINSINISDCGALTEIGIYASHVENLNLSGCNSLCTFKAENSRINSLNLKDCYALHTFDGFNTVFNEADLSSCISLKKLFLYGCKLQKLTARNCVSLETLYCQYNELEKLDLTGCFNLRTVACNNNMLKSLDLSGLGMLEYLSCEKNAGLSALNLAGCTSLGTLICWSSNVQTIDLSGCYALGYLNMQSNELKAINLSDCRSLVFLDCSWGNLSSLSVSNCPDLESLRCEGNKYLNELDVSNNKKLSNIFCNNTKIRELDISGCDHIEWENIGVDSGLYCISIPSAIDGFKTLYVNKRQMIAEPDVNSEYLVPMTKAHKSWFLRYVVNPTKEDMNFKVKVK